MRRSCNGSKPERIDSRQTSRLLTQPVPGFSEPARQYGQKLPLRLVVRTDHSGAILIDMLKLVPNLKDAPGEKCFCRVVNEVSTHCNDSCRRRAGACAGCPQTGHAFGIDNGRHFRSFRRIISSRILRLRRQLVRKCQASVLSCGDIPRRASNEFAQDVAADGERAEGLVFVDVRLVGKVLSNTFS